MRIDIPPDILESVRHACVGEIMRRRRRDLSKRSRFVIQSNQLHVNRLETFLSHTEEPREQHH